MLRLGGRGTARGGRQRLGEGRGRSKGDALAPGRLGVACSRGDGVSGAGRRRGEGWEKEEGGPVKRRGRAGEKEGESREKRMGRGRRFGGEEEGWYDT